MNMLTNEQALERIEAAFSSEPLCSCGEPTTVVARGGDLRLVCVTQDRPLGRILRWRGRFDVRHVSRIIAEDAVLDAAA
jgi:hypothetical protein